MQRKTGEDAETDPEKVLNAGPASSPSVEGVRFYGI